LKVIVKAFGPEIVALIGREKMVKLGSCATLDSLFKALEDEIRMKHGWAQSLVGSSFSVMVNGRSVEAPSRIELKEGDIVSILSQIGGG
jgi:molybdopterin converting factor small subunit